MDVLLRVDVHRGKVQGSCGGTYSSDRGERDGRMA